MYRAGEGGRRAAKKRVTLGSSKRFRAEEARSEVERLRWRVNMGADPQAQKAEQRKSLTVAELADIFLNEHVGAKRKAGTKASYEGVIRTWVEHIDFDRGLLMLPDSKTGKKTIVLNAPALAVLESLPPIGAFVIAGESADTDDEKPRADLKRPWALVTRQAGLSGLRIHDLLHNFAAFGAGGGMGLPIIGKLLGHSQPQTTARYAHLDADPLRRASNTIGATIAAAMGEPAGDGKVVKLRDR